MTAEELDVGLLIGGVVVLLAIAAVRLSAGTGLPSLLLYLAFGLALGESGVGVEFDDAELTQMLGYSALALILAEGGLTTRWDDVRAAMGPAVLLATLGTAVSVAVVGAAAHLLLGVGWSVALLIGAVVSSTDSAAVFSVLRRVPLPRRLTGILEAESGLNDAPAVLAVVTLTGIVSGDLGGSTLQLALLAPVQLLGGAVVGLAVGWVGASRLRSVALPSSGLYPIAVMALAAVAYSAAAVLGLSGFLAVYLSGLVLGNARLPHRAAVRGFAEGLGWLAQIGLFVLLGLLASPSRLPEQILPALGIGLVLLLVARPLSVVLSVGWFGVSRREQAFLSWAGLRGAVPIVLATVPEVAGVESSDQIFDLVFVLVVVFTVVQAPTLPLMARLLRIDSPTGPVDLDVESSPLGALDADVLTAKVGPASRLHGVELFELRLPVGANVTLVVRDGRSFVPEAHTSLRHGDDLIVVTGAAVRRTTEARLRAVSDGGKLAGWRRDPAP